MVDAVTRRAPGAWNTAWLNTLPPAARFAFYGNATARAAFLPAWGVEFSDEACRARATTERATLWLGPDEYLLIDQSVATTVASLVGSLASVPHALVDISHRQVALEVAGPHAATLVSGACPLDLHLDEFPIDMCTRTVFAKASIVLWRTDIDVFRLEVGRSFANYVTGLLQEIAREFA